jgi:predicted CXXCH cytochrome family protein
MTNKSPHRKMRIHKRELPFVLIVIFLVYLSGCSTTQNFKVLSFLFDGVPNPANDTAYRLNDSLNKADSGALALNTLSKAGPKMIIHPPYQDKQCNSCHDQSTMGKLIKSPPELCYQCHENFTVKYKVLHGPVAGGQCTMCHNPHSSANADLLIRTGQQLCLYCHDAEQVNNSAAHKEIKDTNCTECHNPHGGENRYALR